MKLRDLFAPFRHPNGDDDLKEMDRRYREHEKARDESLLRLQKVVEQMKQQDSRNGA